MLLETFADALEDHDLVCAKSGREALGLLQAGERFDAILCDLMMPDMTGIDLYEKLLVDRPDVVPAMAFMTGGAITGRTGDFVRSVPNRVIEKPVALATLRDAVQELLATRTAFRP